jgi:hypothetical protein
MFSFLEFLIAAYLGPPNHSRDDGQSYWACPFCDSPRFHTLPDRPPYKHRWRCHRCGARGDEHDLLAGLGGIPKFPDRVERLADLRQQYEAGRGHTSTKDGTHNGTGPISSPGSSGGTAEAGGKYPREWTLDDTHELYDACQELSEEEWEALAAALRIMREVNGYQQRTLRLSKRFLTFEGLALMSERQLDFDRRHLEQCRNRDCTASVCRRARGLPPLTPEESAEVRRQARERQSCEGPSQEVTAGAEHGPRRRKHPR